MFCVGIEKEKSSPRAYSHETLQTDITCNMEMNLVVLLTDDAGLSVGFLLITVIPLGLADELPAFLTSTIFLALSLELDTDELF